MPTTLRTQVTLPTASGLPQDVCMNTWHCISNAVDRLDDAEGFVSDLLVFYLVIDTFLSGRLSTDIAFDVYDLVDASPRTPIYHFDSTLSVGTGDGLPNEVAICLSYRGALGSGLVPARHRGRIYLGPLDGGVVDQGTGDTIVDISVRNAIATAAGALKDDTTGNGWPWAVFSPTNAGSPPWSSGDLLVGTDAVVAGYVDDAFDTIRSRGGSATARSLFD